MKICFCPTTKANEHQKSPIENEYFSLFLENLTRATQGVVITLGFSQAAAAE